MKSTLLTSIFGTLVCLLFANSVVDAQGVGASGEIRGTVTDPTGAVIPKATVVAEDTEKGIRRTSVTDDDGVYEFPGLQPGTYRITIRTSGFQTEVIKDASVNVGQTVILDVRMKISTGSESVEVNTEPPIIDTQRASQADTLAQEYIADLPIDRRDYLTFTLLAPGVSNSNTIADNADFRVKQTPQSGLSFYGSNGRGNSVTVDGGEFNDDSGGVRLNLSQDAVQEFQVNRSNYTAELGGAGGATINIVSKSGTNQLHGNMFGFFRNDALDARDPFAFTQALTPGQTFSTTAQGTPTKDSLSRQQFGANVGFPVQKDKTFLYVAYEGLRSEAQKSVPLLTNSNIFAPNPVQQSIIGGLAAEGNAMVPCITTNPANPFAAPMPLPAQECAAFLSGLLSIAPGSTNPFVPPGKSQGFDPFIVSQFETNGGLFPFATRSHQGSVRLDHRFGDSDQAFLRYSVAHLTESNPDLQALTAQSRGTSELAWDSTAQISYFHQFSSTTQNEARGQWNIYKFNVDTNDPGGPGLDVEGFGFFGRSIFLPSHTIGRRYDFADNLTMVRGHHTFKLGFEEVVRGNTTTSQTFFPGRFEFLELPGFFISPCLTAPAFCGLSPTQPGGTINTLQAWGLGLPAFYEQGFGNPKYVQTRPFTAVYWQDSWKVRPNFALNYGLRYELDSQYGPLNTPKKNFAPRISFSWDPFNDHKTVIRGGYGIFYSPIYAQIPGVVSVLGNNNNKRTIANTLVTINGFPGVPAGCTPGVNCTINPVASSAAIYQVLFGTGVFPCTVPAGQFACITAADVAPFGVSVPNSGPLPVGTVLFAGQKDYRSPLAQQASLGIERDLAAGFSLSLSYIYVHTQHLPVAIDTNLLPGAPICPTAGVAACGNGLGANALPTNGLPFQDWGAPACVANPGLCFADPTHTILQNNVYSSLASSLYHGGILELKKRFSNHFTVLANYTYSRATDDSTDFNSDYSPFNAVCLKCDRSLSDFDQRNKVVVAGVIESPWEHSPIFGGFQLSPIFNYNSGHPFNLLAGADVNGDGHFTNDRPEAAGRNTGKGPDYYNFDLRLGRTFKIGEKASVQITAEGFNLANRTNYASVNNIVGSEFAPPFNVHGLKPGTPEINGLMVPAGTPLSSLSGPSTPLGFTAAFPKREFQIGARLTF
ncbi:MAG TPA: carboxypeptidase regulatory-like domain-containing protein [Candidatus Acidoferrum sp.]|nr:carboxypeptidase regulatory-like domain-containing protein [Candidatus Acidoferrum sp.]